jgi:hypothetical protein
MVIPTLPELWPDCPADLRPEASTHSLPLSCRRREYLVLCQATRVRAPLRGVPSNTDCPPLLAVFTAPSLLVVLVRTVFATWVMPICPAPPLGILTLAVNVMPGSPLAPKFNDGQLVAGHPLPWRPSPEDHRWCYRLPKRVQFRAIHKNFTPIFPFLSVPVQPRLLFRSSAKIQ